MSDLRSPLAKARDTFTESEAGKRLVCCPPQGENAEYYMKNRIEAAFVAGWNAKGEWAELLRTDYNTAVGIIETLKATIGSLRAENERLRTEKSDAELIAWAMQNDSIWQTVDCHGDNEPCFPTIYFSDGVEGHGYFFAENSHVEHVLIHKGYRLKTLTPEARAILAAAMAESEKSE